MDSIVGVQKNRALALVRYLGYALALLSVGYMYTVVKDVELRPPRYTALTYVLIVLLACGHMLIPFVSAYVWKLTVELASGRSMRYREAISIYLRANIAKYLPGNVLQYAGRNYLGVRSGWTHLQLSLGSFLEVLGGILIPFAILATLGLTRLWTLPTSYSLHYSLPSIPSGGIVVVVALVLVAAGGMFYLKNRWTTLHKAMAEFEWRSFLNRLPGTVVQMTLLSLMNTILYTLFFYAIGTHLLGVYFRNSDFINIACSLTAAGYAGILTPGLPGGIGVKESLSVVLLSGYGYDKPGLVAVSLTARAFLVVGDAAGFFVATRLAKTKGEAA
jgi:hypothetical protein